MIQPAFEILNQRGTPMFFSDVFANRPTAGIVGRIFISTDTYAFYRDTGSGWDLIGGPGTGTITGSGAVNQVAFWNGSSTITGENNLWWDSTNNHFGINTNTPGTAADIHHDQSTILQLNQTTAANDTRIAFQNSGTALWRIGNFYTAGANDWGIYDVVGAIQPLTIVKTTGQTFIGSKTTASGRLVVNSASSDAHVQVVGASAPSIRIDNAGTGATQRLVFGLATATNNFIQGSTAGDICISTASSSPLLFGMWQTINASEVMRLSTSNNLLLGSVVDTGEKIQVTGNGSVTGTFTTGSPLSIKAATPFIRWQNLAGTRLAYIQHATNLVYNADSGIHVFNQQVQIDGSYTAGGTAIIQTWQRSGGAVSSNMLYDDSNTTMNFGTTTAHNLNIKTNNSTKLSITSSGLFLFNTLTTQATAGGVDISSGGLSFISGADNNSTTRTDSTTKLTRFGLVHYTNSEAPVCICTVDSGSTINSLNFGGGAGAMNSMQRIVFNLGATNTTKSGTEVARFVNSNFLIGTTTDAGWKTEINGKLKTTGNTCISGTISIASGVTSTIYTIPSTTTAGGLYHVVVGVLAGGNIYTASGIVTASSWNTQADFTSIYDGANVTLSLSGMDIQIKNDGFGTFTWTYSIHFIPINNA